MRGGWVGEVGDMTAVPELLWELVGRPACILWIEDRRLAPSAIVVVEDEVLLGLLGVLLGRDINAAAMSHSSWVHTAPLSGVSVCTAVSPATRATVGTREQGTTVLRGQGWAWGWVEA